MPRSARSARRAAGGARWPPGCAGLAAGLAGELPRREKRAPRPTRYGTAFWTVRPDGAVLLRRRPESGLLGGMMEIPSTRWTDGRPGSRPLAHAPAPAEWMPVPGRVRHSFTHFHLELEILSGHVKDWRLAAGVWSPVARLDEHALPSVMKKVVRHALAHAGR